jgi:regulator of protease activity HflC (stomatin/prohibitin superfamily)
MFPLLVGAPNMVQSLMQAGGLGLNLTAADVVIIFDSDWNPQNDLQAMARAHRIGQTKAVRVYRLLTAKTYEMHMFHSASMKLGLERAVLSQQREQSEEGSKKKALASEIDNLLKKGAYDVFRDDDDEEANKFMETDIDQLMEISAKTVTYGKQESNLSSGLGSFSKASFVTDTGDGEKDVDLDDPDFWSKAVGLDKPVEIPEEISQMIDDGVKRSRKQVQQFNPYAEYTEKEEKRIQAEREENDRIREEKKRRKMLAKDKKRNALDEKEDSTMQAKLVSTSKKRKKSKDGLIGDLSSKKKKKRKLDYSSGGLERYHSDHLKKLSKKRALQKLENEDPAIEKLKQAWEISHRNRVIAACIRFGFSRFTKIRNESGFQSLPIQDIEVFCRSCKYTCRK